jgi:hypothetical protein
MLNNTIKIWKERNKIFEGVRNNIFKKEHIEEIAFSRNEICVKCPYLDVKGDKCAVIGTQPCCSECGCSLRLKTRSLASSCPKEFWSAVTTEQEEDLIRQSINKIS